MHEDRCSEMVENSTVLATALVGHIGYEKSAEIAKQARCEGKTIRCVLLESKILPESEVDRILSLYQVTKPGIPGK